MDTAEHGTIEGYHAHVYYTPETKAVAAHIREEVGKAFSVTLGRWHDESVGPHPGSTYQVAFAKDEFARLVPWLMLHREGLSILVHPLTGDEYEDHANFSLWLGPAHPLRLDVLERRRESTR
jgi:DOPA 4,5-dioxygenase